MGKGILLFFVWIVFGCVTNAIAQQSKIDAITQMGDYGGALQLLETQLAQDSTDCGLLLQGSALNEKLNFHRISFLYAEKAWSHCPDDPAVRLRYARLLYKRGLYTDVENVLSYDTSAVNYGSTELAAQNSVKKKDYNKAIDHYLLLHQIDTLNSFAYNRMGIVYQQIGNIDSAMLCYNKAISIDSMDYESIVSLSNLLHRNGLADSALFWVEFGLEKYSNDVSLTTKKANILFGQEKYLSAVPLLEYVLAQGDTNYVVLRQYGVACHMGGIDRMKAVEVLQQCCKLKPDDYTAFFYLGLALRNEGRYNESADKIEEAIDLMIPRQIDLYYVELGNSFLRNEDYNKTIEAYKKALEYSPWRKDILIEIGLVYELHLKNYDKAFECFSRFVEEYEGNDEELKKYAIQKRTRLKEELFFR